MARKLGGARKAAVTKSKTCVGTREDSVTFSRSTVAVNAAADHDPKETSEARDSCARTNIEKPPT